MDFKRFAVKEMNQPRYMLAGDVGYAYWVTLPLNATFFTTDQDALNSIEIYKRADPKAFVGKQLEVVELKITVQVIA